MAFQYKTITLDSYFLAGLGDFENVQALDPPNTLSLGLPSGLSITTGPEFQELSVLSRIREGAGVIIGNEGLAGPGAKTGGTWKADADGTVYIENPRISYQHHASMAGPETGYLDDYGNPIQQPIDISAALSVRNPASGNILSKAGLFQFRVTPWKALELKQSFYQIFPTPRIIPRLVVISLATGGNLFGDGNWHSVGFTMKATNWSIIYDGFVLKQGTFQNSRTTDPGNQLKVGNSEYNDDPLTGDLDNIVYMGTGSAISFFNKLRPPSGVWTSPVIDLGATYVFDSVTNAGYISQDHSASLIVRLSDTKDLKHVQPASINLSEEFVPPDAYPSRRLYPVQWAEGRYAQVLISMSQGRSNFSPNLSNVQVKFRKSG